MAMDVAMARVRATVRVDVTAMAAIGSSYGHAWLLWWGFGCGYRYSYSYGIDVVTVRL